LEIAWTNHRRNIRLL